MIELHDAIVESPMFDLLLDLSTTDTAVLTVSRHSTVGDIADWMDRHLRDGFVYRSPVHRACAADVARVVMSPSRRHYVNITTSLWLAHLVPLDMSYLNV
jgi:hypothetical protein